MQVHVFRSCKHSNPIQVHVFRSSKHSNPIQVHVFRSCKHSNPISFIPWTYLTYFICFPFYNRAATLSVWATIRERSVKKTITECLSTAAAPSPLTTVTTTETPLTAGHSGKKQDFGTIRFGGPGWPWMDPIGADMLQARDGYSGGTVICLIQITLTFQRWREWCWGRLELTVLL